MIFSQTLQVKKKTIQTSSEKLKHSSTSDWGISGNYTSIFYWVQKFNFRCADFNSDHVKTNAFLLLFLIYLFCFKTGKIYYWASETNLISHLQKEKVRQKVYSALLKLVNIIQLDYGHVSMLIITEFRNWWLNVIAT